MSRRAALWLIALFLLLHNAEEALTFPAYLPEIPRRLPAGIARLVHVTYPQMLAALALATVIPILLIAWVARCPDRPTRLWLALLLQAVVLLNVFSHLASAALVMRGYSPGLLTALLINLPFSIYLLRRAMRERWVSRRALWLAVPAAVVVHGPLLIGLVLLAGSLSGR
ncbi:HXXEE domain-containing protein [Longimicrobium sp.]|uniref:HXXEE domain-containing protein n=1 Tax=Longimicrobium sp. TaxID=2029185 RepID=UPI002CCD7D5B|nr:HXXEE domain-containing protein [Longimicrobium sp.]HSU16298.1 HXXEE domain-containing protein [Longimicrobium sp.]